METQTRFDLNAAIAKWQQELAAQPDLAPVDCRELETHLRDTVAELQGRGLNNEESFWLARRRVGQPEQLNEEFAKADPVNVWRERLFWMVLAFLMIDLWNTDLIYFILHKNRPVSLTAVFFEWFPLLIGLTSVVLIAKGWLKSFIAIERIFLHTRLRIIVVSALWILINAKLLNVVMIQNWSRFIGEPAVLLGLLLLLAPKQTYRETIPV